jgi:myo-inositol catabolism protein IolC
MKQELFILPFDHRSSFIKDVLKVQGKPNKKQTEAVSHLKETIFLGFLDYAKDRKNFGILVDEEYGKEIIKKAKKERLLFLFLLKKAENKSLNLNTEANSRTILKNSNPITLRY